MKDKSKFVTEVDNVVVKDGKTTVKEEKQEEKKAPVPRPEPSAKKAANAPIPDNGTMYSRGEKDYNPRVQHNQEAWEKVQAALTKSKGKATYKDLAAVLSVHFKYSAENHHNFINYMVRRKSLLVLAAK